jgi:hypothetical protein
VVTQPINAPEKKNPVIYGVYSATEITQPTIRAVWSTKTYRKKTYQPLWQKHYIPPASLQKTVHAQPGLTYAQITKHNLNNPVPQDPSPITNDLKLLLKTLFEQLSTMLNLLSTVLSKLP